MSTPGIGVIIDMLGGYGEAAAALIASQNKSISSMYLNSEDELRIGLEDGTVLVLWDNGQSCCENRYMRTDDDLDSFVGDIFLGIEILSGPEEEDDYGGGVHEVQFLHIRTSGGTVVCSSHNEHNGYYGGFSIKARLEMHS